MLIIIQSVDIEIYVAPNGKMPFVNWMMLLDGVTRGRVKERIDRVSLGNFGDYKYLKSSIYELRFNFGPGYRVYFGKNAEKKIVLLLGGIKAQQQQDIKKAVIFWDDYLSRGG